MALAVPALFVLACGDDASSPGTGGGTTPTSIEGAVLIPEGWAGTWHLRVTFRDCVRERVTVVEDVVDVICEGDTLAIKGSGIFGDCDGIVSAEQLAFSCVYPFTDGTCDTRVSFAIELHLDGDEMTGEGIWSTAVGPECGLLQIDGCERIDVEGTRLDAFPGVCVPVGTVAERFRLQPRTVLPFRGGVR